MLLSEYFKESKYASNGENYEVLEAGKNQRSPFTVKCLVCNEVRTTHERKIKTTFTSQFTKEQLRSGFTETIQPSELMEFLQIQSRQYEETIWQLLD